MHAYFDTSAVVPLLVRESSSELCRRVFAGADAVLTSRLTCAEVSAALAMAARMDRITEADRVDAWETFRGLWPTLDVVEVTSAIVESAAELAVSHELRGYAAVHCAAALAVSGAAGVSVSGDSALIRAWTELGISTIDTSPVG